MQDGKWEIESGIGNPELGILPPVEVDPFRNEPILRRPFFIGRADGDHGNGDDAGRNGEGFPDFLHPVFPGVDTQPHRAEPQFMGSQQYVLSGRRAILDEKAFSIFRFCIAANYDGLVGL